MTAQALYTKLENDRRPYLDRAWDCSEVTIPHLLPRDGHSSASVLPTPYQGIGARGVNNLAAKLLLALLPPNSPFFRLNMTEAVQSDLEAQAGGDEGIRNDIQAVLARIERSVMDEIEGMALRVSANEGLRHLIVTGNSLLYLPPDGGLRVFKLNQYVVRRSPEGTVLDIVVKESVAPGALPENIQKMLSGDSAEQNADKTVDLYTQITRDKNVWRVFQEIKGMRVPSSVGSYPIDKSPWIPMRWNKIDGENYGRGYVEEYLGDLKSLEGLSQAIVEGSAAAAKLLFLINPNGQTRAEDLAQAENGAFVDGLPEEVQVLQMQKHADFRVAQETMRSIAERLSFAFLLNSSIQRSGERVTAEEIRYMAAELEDSLGGIYSILTQEFQLPLVRRVMYQMERQGKIPPMPTGTVRPVIVTGMEALGRGHELERIRGLIADLAPFGEMALQRLNMDGLIMRIAAARGIEPKGLIKSEEQIEAEQQAAMQQQMLQQGMGPMIQAGGRIIEKGMDNGQGQ